MPVGVDHGGGELRARARRTRGSRERPEIVLNRQAIAFAQRRRAESRSIELQPPGLIDAAHERLHDRSIRGRQAIRQGTVDRFRRHRLAQPIQFPLQIHRRAAARCRGRSGCAAPDPRSRSRSTDRPRTTGRRRSAGPVYVGRLRADCRSRDAPRPQRAAAAAFRARR